MKKISILLPDAVSIEEMLSVRGGISSLSTTTESDDKITIECKPGPAVRAILGMQLASQACKNFGQVLMT